MFREIELNCTIEEAPFMIIMECVSVMIGKR